MGIADQNTYLKYKREQKLLVYWVVNTSNRIIQSLPNDTNEALNTTGEIRMSSLLSLSALIAKHANPIPSVIYHLFQSIIEARTQTYSLFQQFTAKNPGPEVEKSNVSHRHWIDGLTEAFDILGGNLWAEEQRDNGSIDEEDAEQVIFANKFSALNMDSDVGEDKESEGDEPQVTPTSTRQKNKAGKKGKKGKRGRKPKARSKKSVKVKTLEELPLESYRIIEDEDGIITDYLMAVYSTVSEWIQLRHYLQSIWYEATYDGLNTAVAGAVSNIAIAMVSQTQSRIFIDFPGHDSYETIMKTITRGNPEKAQGKFHLSLCRVEPHGQLGSEMKPIDIDVKEQFLVHAYYDLLDFIKDFQKTRSGKPTKSMSAQIGDWDPEFNLAKATKEQRIKWRRAYTINWLYDLVNLFSSIVIQRITMKGQNINLESVDWSTNGPWNVHRRLYGLNEFAGAVTGFAMQKSNTDVQSKILPHHVFQLQSIVDSLTVSRGWSNYSLEGHVLRAPAQKFRPRRDVDLFMDRKEERFPNGICLAFDMLVRCFKPDAMIYGRSARHKEWSDIFTKLRDDFVNWLGETKYMHGLKTIPPSRFSNTNSNGLWEYSPFLCGVGLAEGLIWYQKGYIQKPVGLYQTLQDLLPYTFFAGGKVPTSNFEQGLLDIVAEGGSRRAIFRRVESRRAAARNAKDIHGLLDSSLNRFFKTESMLTLYREASWIPDRIPDSELYVLSTLAMLRMALAKKGRDPVTGKADEESIAETLSIFREAQALPGASGNKPMALLEKPGHLVAKPIDRRRRLSLEDLNKKELLEIFKSDLQNDIIGVHRPLSSLNYVWVTARFMHLFSEVEDELKRLRNPLWVRVYESSAPEMREKRSALTLLILAKQDPECMQVWAKWLENPRIGYMTHIYWEDLDDMDPTAQVSSEEPVSVDCSMM